MYNLILVPSLFCPASCKYCFGPNQGIGNVPYKGEYPSGMYENRTMDASTIEYALDFALRLIEKPHLIEGLPLCSKHVSLKVK